MRSLLIVSCLIAALAAGARAQSPAGAPVRLLEIDAVAADKKGVPVQDLKREEIEVWIEGYRIPVETLSVVDPTGERTRRSIVLLLDDITLSPTGVARARDIARRFINRLGAGDQMAIVALSGAATVSTDDREALLRALNAYNTRGGQMRPDVLSAQVLASLTAISRQVAESPARRRTIVGIGSSWLFDTPIPPVNVAGDLRKEWTAALRAMTSQNVTLYAIDPGGVGESRVSGGGTGFARQTGGWAFSNTNDTEGAVARIMRDAVLHYTISIADPPIFQTADLRALDVRVLRRGVTITAPSFLAAPRR